MKKYLIAVGIMAFASLAQQAIPLPSGLSSQLTPRAPATTSQQPRVIPANPANPTYVEPPVRNSIPPLREDLGA